MSMYTIIVRYEFSAAWLRLSRDERRKYEQVFGTEIVAPFMDRLKVTHHDAEAFATDYSDFLLIEASDLTDYYHFIETLRDSDFIAHEWVRLHDITIGIPDGYKEYENAHNL